MLKHTVFQSTPPARGATEQHKAEMDKFSISIHAPREGGDRGRPGDLAERRHDFNPRPPRGGRRAADVPLVHRIAISIHAPREGGDF